MLPTQDMLYCMAKILCTIQTVNTLSLTRLIYMEQIPCTGIGRQDHGIFINYDQAFLHIFCNQGKLFLLLFRQIQLLLDLSVLSVDLT